MTFEPDGLNLPEGLYNIYFTPNNGASEFTLAAVNVICMSTLFHIAHKIMQHASERLGVQTRLVGFDNETHMVKNLAATPANRVQSCFVRGAGENFSTE